MGDDDPAESDEPGDRRGGDDPEDRAEDHRILHRRIEPEPRDADYRLLNLLADAEGVDVTELEPIYDRIDHLVSKIYENPPSPEAQVELSFSYAGYRITLDQNGNVSLLKITDGQPTES